MICFAGATDGLLPVLLIGGMDALLMVSRARSITVLPMLYNGLVYAVYMPLYCVLWGLYGLPVYLYPYGVQMALYGAWWGLVGAKPKGCSWLNLISLHLRGIAVIT